MEKQTYIKELTFISNWVKRRQEDFDFSRVSIMDTLNKERSKGKRYINKEQFAEKLVENYGVVKIIGEKQLTLMLDIMDYFGVDTLEGFDPNLIVENAEKIYEAHKAKTKQPNEGEMIM